MTRQTIKDSHFHTIGYIDTAADGRQTARDAHFSILGYYDPKSNATRNAHFTVVAYGNQLAALMALT